MAAKRYSFEKLAFELGQTRKANWTFAGTRVSGDEIEYVVTDGNFPARNRWDFIIRKPRARGGRIEVRPRTAPNVRAWAELPDRSLTFSRATKAAHVGKYYCPVALADVTGERSRVVVNRDERDRLPAWFGKIARGMRAKETVRHTRGTDGNSLVALVRTGDYEEMIRMFFATKVWILKEGFALP
ncbi:MAG: hypothetical protein H0U85_06895 [Gemmatimonadales bacterium]|nr:hypothetical protein [Gemmatimonadales bacterium]